MQNTFSGKVQHQLGNLLLICATWVMYRPFLQTAVTRVPSGGSEEKDALQRHGMLLALEYRSEYESNT
jgi:hypothetical protein